MLTSISALTRGGWVLLGGGARILRHHQQQELDQSDVGNSVSWFAPCFDQDSNASCFCSNACSIAMCCLSWGSDSRRLTFLKKKKKQNKTKTPRSPERLPVSTGTSRHSLPLWMVFTQMFASYESVRLCCFINADGKSVRKKIEMSVTLNAQLESGNIGQISPKTFFWNILT